MKFIFNSEKMSIIPLLLFATVALILISASLSGAYPLQKLEIFPETGRKAEGVVVDEEDVDTSEDFDYPADTHGGAVRAFSQLVSDGSGSSRSSLFVNRRDDDTTDNTDVSDTDDNQENDVDGGDVAKFISDGNSGSSNNSSALKMNAADDPGDNETQYLIEEIYGYAYDESGESVDGRDAGSGSTDFEDETSSDDD